jgi:transposase-like protein
MDVEKTGDIKCPNCSSNNVLSTHPPDSQGIKCACRDCGQRFTVPNTDGVATSDSDQCAS